MGDRRRPALPSALMTRQIEQDAKPGSGEAGGEPRPPQIAIRAASRLGAAGGHRRAHHPRCLPVKQRLLATTALRCTRPPPRPRRVSSPPPPRPPSPPPPPPQPG